MYVVWHQAVSNDVDCKALCMIAKQIQISYVVAATEEYTLALIAPLCHMMGQAGKDSACASRHPQTLHSIWIRQ